MNVSTLDPVPCNFVVVPQTQLVRGFNLFTILCPFHHRSQMATGSTTGDNDAGDGYSLTMTTHDEGDPAQSRFQEKHEPSFVTTFFEKD